MLRKVGEKIFYMSADESTDRPVLGYVKGSKYSLMIDAGNSSKHAMLFLEELRSIGLDYPSFVGITHWHWDHCYGLCIIDAPAICCVETNRKLQEMSQWEWSDEAMENRLITGEDIAFCDENIRKEYSDRGLISVKTADILFEEKLILNLGECSCHFLRLENSHSPDSVVIYVPEQKVIFLGDIFGPDFHHGEPKYYQEKHRKLISALENLAFETAILGHDEPVSKEELMQELKEELSS